MIRRTTFGIAALLLLVTVARPARALEPRLTVSIQSIEQTHSIPQGAQRVPVLSLHLSASCDANVMVTTLLLRHGGLGSVDDILRVYAMKGMQRISRGHALHDDEALRIPLSSIIIPACGFLDLTVHADFSAAASVAGEHQFEITAVEISNGSFVAPSTIQSRERAVTVTPSGRQASLTATFRPVTGSVSFGKNRIVARLLLESGANADQWVQSIVFTNKGSASNADLQNLFLETSAGERHARDVPKMDGKTVTILLNPPLLLKRSQQKLLHLRADVRGSRRKTMQWSIEEPSDIHATQAGRTGR